jgi:Methylase of polypeptide chain release factors
MDALTLAQENSKFTNLDVEFIHADVLNINSVLLDKKWDCIISNPPYIPYYERESIAENVLNFEPEISLFVKIIILSYSMKQLLNMPNQIFQKMVFCFLKYTLIFPEISELLNLKGFINIELRKDLQGKIA